MIFRSKRVINTQLSGQTDTQLSEQLTIHCTNKDLVNIVREYLEPPVVMTLLLKEFSDKCTYHDRRGLKVEYSGLCKKVYNYGNLNDNVFLSNVRFIGSRDDEIFNKYGKSVGVVSDRYFATLAPCDLS